MSSEFSSKHIGARREHPIRWQVSKRLKKKGHAIQKTAGSLPEKTAYRRASDEGKAISEVSYLSLRKRADEVVQDIINRITENT